MGITQMNKFILLFIWNFILKILGNFSDIKKELNNDIEISLSESLKRGVQLLYDYNILYSNLEGYVHGHKPSIRRILLVSIGEIMSLVMILRLLLSAVYNENPGFKLLLNDFLVEMEIEGKNKMIIYILVIWGCLFNIIVQGTFNYKELTHKLKFMDYLYDITQNKPAIQLSYSLHTRLTLRIHLYSKYICHFGYVCTVLIGIIFVAILSLMNSPDFLSKIMALIWLIPTFFLLKFSCGLTQSVTIIFVFCVFYLKYAFNTIEDNIKLCLKCRNSKLVIKAINEHRIAEQMCKDFNDFFKILNFIIYFILSPAQMLNFRLISNENSPTSLRIFGLISFVLVYTLAFNLILINSQIIRSAHRPRKYFYGYLNRKGLPFKTRTKIMNFTEWLCGPDIGFYCMDWFPMNSFEFYKYCAFCVSFYIMVSGFFS